MCTFEVYLKIPDMHGAPQQNNAQFSFNHLLCEYAITRCDSDFNKLMIKITGETDICVLEQFFLQIYKIFFFNYGYFPEIVSGFKPQLPYYTSAKANHAGFFRNFPPIVKDLSHILNENILQKIESMYNSSHVKIEPILHGFFSLFSHDYERVLIEHKMILLLHIFEGYARFLENDVNVEYAARYILQECYTKNYKNTSHEILIDDATKDIIRHSIAPLLKEILSSRNINEEMLNIRNYYSHFYEKNTYQTGKILFSLFLLISLSIRIRIINDIITPSHFFNSENKNIKECFFIIADYINEIILEKKDYQFQSNYYGLIKIFEMIRKECAS